MSRTTAARDRGDRGRLRRGDGRAARARARERGVRRRCRRRRTRRELYQQRSPDAPRGRVPRLRRASRARARIQAIVADGTARAVAAARADEGEVDPRPHARSMRSRAARSATPARSWRRGGQAPIVDTVPPRRAAHRPPRARSTEGGCATATTVAVHASDPRRRQGLARLHHTGTHLLHAALRACSARTCTQAGSLVAPDRLRFDFSHAGRHRRTPRSSEIEELVNEQVQANVGREHRRDGPRRTRSERRDGAVRREVRRPRARRSGSATSRRSSAAAPTWAPPARSASSRSCREGAVASGVRRIEAVTGEAALRHVGREEAALRESAGLLKIPPLELPRRLQKLLDDQKQLEKQLAQLEARLARSRAEDLVSSAQAGGGRPRARGPARRPRPRRPALGRGHAPRASSAPASSSSAAPRTGR